MATKTRRLADLLANIDDNSKVTSAGLLDATITAADLAANSVGASELADNAVDTDAIADDAVDADKLASNAVVSASIVDANITAAKLSSTALASVEHVKPHIQPGTLYPAYSGLLTDNTGYTFTDSSASAHVISASKNAHHSAGSKKIGSTSLSVNKGLANGAANTGEHLYFGANNADFDFGSGDFTIEFWFNVREFNPTGASFQTWVGPSSIQWGGSNGFQCLTIGATPKAKFGIVLNSSAVALTGTTTIVKDTWYHYAAVRIGTSLKLYLNGAQEATATVSGAHSAGNGHANRPITIGSRQNNATSLSFDQFSDVNVDEVRIVKGLGVYTGAFTAPTTALTTTWSAGTNIAANSTASNVKFLLHSDAGGHSGAYGTAQSDGKKYYYTDIKGSKPIKDPRIGAHFGGTGRHKLRSLQLLEQETATQGSDVWSLDGREWMRCTGGNWHMLNNGHGQRISVGNVSSYPNAYIEVVGYFNGIHTSAYTDSNHKFRYTLDGGSEVATDYGANDSGHHLSGTGTRYVDSGSVTNIPISTTLGIHTIKLRSTGAEHDVFGVELIAQDKQDFTATNATNILTSAGHTLSNGDQIRLAGADLPNGLNATTTYFVIGVSGNNFQVATTSTGSAVTFSDDGSGTRTFTSLNTIQIPAQNVVSYGKKLSVSATAHHYNPFAVAADNTTAVGIGNAGAHGKVATGWSGTTAGHFDSTLDTATSLGLDAWETGGNYYRPVNGGRIVKWIDTTGAIKTSVNMMPPSAKATSDHLYTGTHAGSTAPNAPNWPIQYQPIFSTGAIDDTQAEVARTFHFREFGNGSANYGPDLWEDFSTIDGGNSRNDSSTATSYVMDDGLTAMSGKVNAVNSHPYGVYCSTDNDKFYITFIGTGLSFYDENDEVYDTLVQNLPYGTHTLEHFRDATIENSTVKIDGVQVKKEWLRWWDLTFYQPKMPPIPDDACIIADYMLMADFVPDTVGNATSISKGVRRCNNTRDLFYTETDNGSITFAKQEASPTGFTSYLSDGSALSATAFKVRLPSFGTNIVHRGHGVAAKSDQYIDDTIQTSTDGTATADTSAHWLATSQPLGLYKWGHNAKSGQPGNIEAYDIATPIHTSSHYQEFETQYLNELVAGDRNMEHTNLVVTADGKSWDEITRNTSYISKDICVQSTTDSQFGTGGIVVYDEWRGGQSGHTHRHMFNKGWAIGWDRVYCLVDGMYEISAQMISESNAAGATAAIWINGQNQQQAHFGSGGSHEQVNNKVVLWCQKGDYIQTSGIHHDNDHYSNFTIKKVS